jgi:hypothetical protein
MPVILAMPHTGISSPDPLDLLAAFTWLLRHPQEADLGGVWRRPHRLTLQITIEPSDKGFLHASVIVLLGGYFILKRL